MFLTNNKHRLVEISQYLVTAFVTLLFTVLVFHLWEINLNIPFAYKGDTFSQLFLIKSVIQTGWFTSNPYTGAPFGSTFFDYPGSDSLHYLIFLIMSFFTKNPFYIYNIYYLAGFPLAALTAVFVLKKLNISFLLALCGAVSFAFLSYHLQRYSHLLLASYYMVPLGLYVVIQVVKGNLNVILWDQQTRRLKINLKQPKIWIYLLICILAASSGVYYAFFIAFICAVSALWCYFTVTSDDRFSRLLSCLALAFVLMATAGINTAPTFIYTRTHGEPTQLVASRNKGEAEVYGLKIIQLLLPTARHRFTALADIAQYYNKQAPLVNENNGAALGLVGTVGFLYSLLVLFRRQNKNPLFDYLSMINVLCVLLATIGGFGSVVSFFILSSIRGYNRICVIIGFISIAVFCNLAQDLWGLLGVKIKIFAEKRSVYKILSTGAAVLLMTVIFIDQCFYPAFMKIYQQNKSAYTTDAEFANRIQDRMPKQSMIFQLPFMLFPETSAINKLTSYDPFKPYFFTSNLRWSYGDTKGRIASNWNKATAELPIEEMLQKLAAAGFSGIYVDRFGYKDEGKELEAEFQKFIHVEPLISRDPDKRYSFYDITAFANEYRSQLNTNPQQTSSQALKVKPGMATAGGCSSLEGTPGNQWIWCGDTGELIITNNGKLDGELILTFDVKTASAEPGLLLISGKNLNRQIRINSSPKAIQLMIPIKANVAFYKIFFECDAPAWHPQNTDPRKFVFKIINPSLTEKTVTGAP